MTKQPLPLLRLLAFSALSITLHAFVLSVSLPRNEALGGAFYEPTHLVVRLALFSAEQPATRERTEDERNERKSVGREADGGAEHRRALLPLPDVWFAAEELSVRAEPLTDVQIHYPPVLEGSGMTGSARVLLHIDERGLVRKAHIEASSPDASFGEAALSAWKEVRFSPALKDGMAVKSRKVLEISFLP
jgi:TonB family protein